MGHPLSKHPGGRPTKYNRAILEQTMDYLANHHEYDDPVPTVAGLSQVLNVTRETVIQWSNDDRKKEFSYIIKRLMAAQESGLVRGGLGNKLNPGIVKLMLSKHGYSDTQGNQGVSVNISIDRSCGGAVTVSQSDKSVTIEHED